MRLAVAKGHWPTVDVIPPEVLADVAKTAQRVAKASIERAEAERREPAAGQWRRGGAERAAPPYPHPAALSGRQACGSTGTYTPGDKAEIEAICQG